MSEPAAIAGSVGGPLPARPHRVVFTDSTAGGVVGGSLTGILALLAHLDRRRFEPMLVLFEPKPVAADLEARGIPVHVLPPLATRPLERRGSRPRRAVTHAVEFLRVVVPRARQLVRLFRRERPAIVYCTNGIAPSSRPAMLAAAICRVPLVCHFKGHFKGPRHVAPEARFMSRWIDTAIAMTDEILDQARSRGVRAQRFLTIFDGIDPKAYVPGKGAAVRRELGIPSDAPVVGIVGHIQPWKGQLLVVEAVARARREIPGLYCVIVGGVHQRGKPYAAELRTRIAAPDLSGHVVLTGARHDVLACMEAMDVVLHASDREPFGRVLIEAMAIGRPVIAPREGGPLLIVVDGETGLLVPPRDAGALADALLALLADPARRAAMGRAGRARVDAVFDIRHHVRAMEALFDEVLARRQGTTR